MKLTLISHPLCPYVQRAVIVLEEKQAEYERIDIDLRAKPDWFLAISPLGKTPVLRVGEHAIFESAVICEYLEDTIPPAMHPADPLQRALHRAWIEFASAMLNTIWTYCTAKDEAAFDAAAKTLPQQLGQVEQALGDGPYFAGARFSLVDAAFAPAFRYFDVLDDVSGVDFFAGMPKARAWRAALAQRPSVQKAVSKDYAEQLRQFLTAQGGVLGQRFHAVA